MGTKGNRRLIRSLPQRDCSGNKTNIKNKNKQNVRHSRKKCQAGSFKQSYLRRLKEDQWRGRYMVSPGEGHWA
jgi:hypothetical protein